ncbi:hypothetical protein OAX78_00395 [Planctomycetota bacterium]|nr:hypothetical protein [Planctomycetota bacterium]
MSGTMSDGFLAFSMGGIGTAGGERCNLLYEEEGRPFPLVQVQIDTDPRPSDAFDERCFIPLTEATLSAMKANPAHFGHTVEQIMGHYGALLDPEDAHNGSRTTRLLTQLAFAAHEKKVIKLMRTAVRELRRRGAKRVIPIFLSSSGGGCGSALQALLAWKLHDRSVQRRVAEGFGESPLQRPVAFVVEPFAHAIRSADVDADKILGNSYAFRIESAILERMGAYKYVFHLGMANDSGTVLDTPEELARVLGTSVYTFMRDWSSIKARLVDTVDSRFGHVYTGKDAFPADLNGNGRRLHVPTGMVSR